MKETTEKIIEGLQKPTWTMGISPSDFRDLLAASNQMKIGKCVKTGLVDEDTYLCLYEYPDGSLVIEGIRNNPNSLSKNDFLSQRIRFTRPAIRILNQVLGDWLNGK